MHFLNFLKFQFGILDRKMQKTEPKIKRQTPELGITTVFQGKNVALTFCLLALSVLRCLKFKKYDGCLKSGLRKLYNI